MKIRSVNLVLTLLAGIIIGGVLILVPLGYFLLSYHHEKGSLETEAVIKARIITQVVSANPDFWEFERVRIHELISERQNNEFPESQRVFNSRNELLVENVIVTKPPVIMESANLYDSGIVVGRVELTRSLYPLLARTGLLFIGMVPSGVGGFLVLYFIPIRMLRRAGEDLRKSEQKYRRLIEIANDAIFVADAATGRILDANRKAEELLGKSLNDIIGMHQSELHPAGEAEKYRKIFMDSILKGTPVLLTDLCVMNSAGKKVPVDISASVTEIEGKKVIQGIFRDVTERIRTEEALRKSEARYSQAASAAHLGHWERDFITSNGFWSRETYNIFGVSPDKFEPTFDNLMSLVHPDDRDELRDALNSALTSRKKINIEYRIVRPDGEMRVIHSKGEARLNDKGEITRLDGTLQDVTDRKHFEETIEWAEQLNIVAQLTKGLAEDIKNSLAGIKASIGVLASEHTFSDEDRTIKVKAMDEIERIKTTVNSLLQFAKPADPKLIMMSMNDILDKTISFSLKHDSLDFKTPSKITFSRHFEKNIPDTMGDPLQLQQIFLNLIFNSFEAMPAGGTVSVSTAYNREQNYIQIAVADTGGGIDEKLKDRIFEPFFTTKPKGTGLGLAITKRTIEHYGGDMKVESTVNEGTVIYINYPVIKAKDLSPSLFL